MTRLLRALDWKTRSLVGSFEAHTLERGEAFFVYCTFFLDTLITVLGVYSFETWDS